MHNKAADIDDYPALENEEGAWYTRYHFISHAGGAIDGRAYTNSQESWEQLYEKGNRVVDADLAFTTDGILVLRHSWRDNLEQMNNSMDAGYDWTDRNGHIQHLMYEAITMSYKEFIANPIHYKYTPMTCEDMIQFMKEYPELYVACDMKDDVETSYQYLVDMALKLEAEEILDRIIVNVYSYDAYFTILNIYPFKNITMRQHYISPNNYYEMAKFCLENEIHVVNLSKCYIDDEGVELLLSKGIRVYVACVDYISDMKEYYKRGISGAVTNWLYEADWQYIESGEHYG